MPSNCNCSPVTSDLVVSFEERSIVVRENNTDPAMVCVQMSPGEEFRAERDAITNGLEAQLEIMTKRGSANVYIEV